MNTAFSHTAFSQSVSRAFIDASVPLAAGEGTFTDRRRDVPRSDFEVDGEPFLRFRRRRQVGRRAPPARSRLAGDLFGFQPESEFGPGTPSHWNCGLRLAQSGHHRFGAFKNNCHFFFAAGSRTMTCCCWHSYNIGAWKLAYPACASASCAGFASSRKTCMHRLCTCRSPGGGGSGTSMAAGPPLPPPPPPPQPLQSQSEAAASCSAQEP